MAKVSKDRADNWYDYNIDLDNRTLWLGSIKKDDEDESGVDFTLSESIIKGLHLLEKNAPNGDKPIFIIMNNPGGDEIEGLAIYDAIQACKNHVTGTVFGKCWSMAGYILQACDWRIMAPNATFMLHEGSRALPAEHPRIVKSWNDYHNKVDEVCFDIFYTKMLEKNPDFKAKKLEEMLKFDTILLAKDAIELGLADKVLE